MNKKLFPALVIFACASCLADNLPLVGLVEQIPVMNNGPKVIARPTYILTAQKLSAPTVFSGMVPGGSKSAVACCFEVKNIAPTTLDAELAKYGKDPEFSERMKSVKGYRYIYVAQPTADKQRWTPLMKTLAENAANPEDGSPFSAAVVATQFDKSIVPNAFTVDGAKVTFQSSVDKKTGRLVYVFTQAGSKLEFSEEGFAD